MTDTVLGLACYTDRDSLPCVFASW